MAVYNFDKINAEVPIEAVLEMHGISPQGKGSDKSWYSIRSNEKEPSAHIDKNRRYGNTIHDFGVSNTFNPISLTIFLRDLDKKMSKKEAQKEAARILGEAFGIEPDISDNGKSNKDSSVVSDWEWKELLIYPDMASKNMVFFPDVYGDKQTKEYADKYRVSMNELKSKDIKMYESIIMSRGKGYVLELRNNYYSALYNWYNMRKELNIEFRPEELKNDAEISDYLKTLVTAERILIKALKDTSKNFTPGAYDVISDYKKVVNNEIPIEIGEHSCNDVKRAAKNSKTKVFSTEPISIDEFYKLIHNGLNNIMHAALKKGDNVVVFFVSTDSSKVNYLVQALRGKERNLAEIRAESALEFQKEAQEDIVLDNQSGKVEKSSPSKSSEFVSTKLNNKDTVMGI